MASFKRVNKNKVVAEIKKNGTWKGIAVGNKVNEFHFNGGWHLATNVEVTSLEELRKFESSFMYYLDKELGDRVAYYIEK